MILDVQKEGINPVDWKFFTIDDKGIEEELMCVFYCDTEKSEFSHYVLSQDNKVLIQNGRPLIQKKKDFKFVIRNVVTKEEIFSKAVGK